MSDAPVSAACDMTVGDLDKYFRNIYDFDAVARADVALNGLQVGERSRPVRKVAFAVDACMETFRRATEWGADMLVVHHGLFWGSQAAITGSMYDRISWLCGNNLALFAMHLPLDRHPVTGNNAGLADLLGLRDRQPFGQYKGIEIGVRGVLPRPMTVEEAAARLFGEARACLALLPFGKKENLSVGIVSGGAADTVFQAMDSGLDLFITGDADHTIYHHCMESGINAIFGGHYQTEVWGVSLLAQRLEKECRIETCFIDLPTGL